MNFTDALFIIPVSDTSRPKRIKVNETESVSASWLEPSGTRESEGMKVVLCRFQRSLPTSQEVSGVLALNGRQSWQVAGIVNPETGAFSEKYSMQKLLPYMSDIVDQEAVVENDIEVTPATYRRPVVGVESDFRIGGFAGVAVGVATKREWA